MTETYVVTGGAGFIGSHIVERLLRDGHNARIVDNFLTGKRSNIQHLLADTQYSDRLSLHEVSITDQAALLPIFEGADYVLHQAALASVPRSVANPLETHLHCVTGTLNVLETARQTAIRRVVYASSSSLYGDREEALKSEDLVPQPKSPYGAAKLAAEYYCRAFTATYGLETVALRYFNVFGPRQDPASEYAAVIPKFITRMLAGHAPIIYGDGTQSRDFTYIDNVVYGNLLAAKVPDIGGEAMNLATGGRVTLLELVARLNALLNTDFAPTLAAERPGDIQHSQANIERARRLMDYDPPVDFDTGLARTVAWFRAHV
jgi:UDP-glucose 4-epimerase